MNVHAPKPLSAAEQARRRKTVEAARWDAEMEGLGKPSAERIALDDLYITGAITRDERRARIVDMVAAGRG